MSTTPAAQPNIGNESPVITPAPPTTSQGPPTIDERPASASPPPRTSPQQTQQREAPMDPRVVALRSLFPDYEDVILQSVLESVNWNQDRAVDTLLTMSDPDYKPEPQPQRQSQPVPTLSQEELDEQFARQLIMQEQQQHSQWAASGQGYSPQGAYAQRPGHPQGWTSPQQGGGTQQGQGMAEFQEQFSKIAETGKKTFGTIFSKVKAKLQEFEQGRPAGPGGSTSPPSQYHSTQWAPGPASYYGPPQTGPPQAQTSYYNPNQSPSPSSAHSPSPPQPPAPTIRTATRPVSPPNPAPAPGVTATGTGTQTRSRPESPPATNAAMTGQPLEGSKLRLPPKQQPISLMALQDNHSIDSASSTDSPTIPSTAVGKTPVAGAPTPTHAQKGYSIDDDDDLEYTENPFDDRRK